MNLSYGSQGDEVKKLQESLNAQGYGLSVDGIYGSKTQQAVKDYQSKNSLAVDGIAGTNTLGKLYGTSTPQQPAGTGNDAAAGTAAPDAKPDYSKYAYDASADTAYQEALSALQQAQQALPTYKGTYDQQLQDIYNQIVNRDKFSYDVNSDALYQQYADQYTQQGQMAMMNTMGQAAALTGGYGNSYASTAGNQAYQGYLQQLNAVVPELYGMALDQYNQEGQDLLNQYAMVGDMSAEEYAKYQDSLNQYWQNLSFQKQMADDAYDQGYNNWWNAYQAGYQTERDQVADQQWQKEYDEAVRQFNQQMGLASGGGSSSGGSSGGSSSGGGSGGGSGKGSGKGSYSNGGYDSSVVKQAQKFVGASADGMWGSNSAAAAKAKGYNSLAEVVAAMGGAKPTDTGSGGYYDQLLGAVSTASGAYSKQSANDKQKGYKESVAAINDAYNKGLITAAQKTDLLRIAMPGSR